MMNRTGVVRLIVYIFLALGSAALVIYKINPIQGGSSSETVSGRNALDRKDSDIDLLPEETPTISINDAVLCKTEFDGLKKVSEKTGASGMFLIDRSGLEIGICQFFVRKMSPSGETGTIQMVNNYDGKYGITLRFDAADEKQLFDWSKTALLYFNKDIDEQTAENAIRTAIEEGSAESSLFMIRTRSDVEIKDSKVTPLKIIEIRTP